MQTIDAHGLNARLHDATRRPVVVDVLPRSHFEQQHLPGAANVPLDEDRFVDRVRELTSDHDRPVVVYCENTDCDLSPTAAARLEKAGFDDVVDFAGGVEAWKAAGLPIERN